MGSSFRFSAWWIIFVGFLGLIHARQTNYSVTRILDELLREENYDSRLRPNYDGGPVEVVVGFWVLSIDAINVIDMDFSLDIFFRQEWKDGRLAHGLNKTMFLSNTVTDRIWMPDTYFVNAKNGKFHRVTSDNLMIMILPGGLVKFNVRLTIKAACPMNLRKFPMDTQYCPLIIESYGYSRDHITFKWEQDSTDGMLFVPSTTKMLPQYNLVEMSLTQIQNAYVVGNWSGIKATFIFERMYSYFIIHVYGPCALIVVISWLSFLLPRSSPPARVTLGVTSVLTVVTILNMLNNSMPKVNYVKTIDKYLIGCFLFVFATLAEYALVLLLANRMKKRQMTKDFKKEDNSKEKDNCHAIANGHVIKRKWNPEKVCSTELELMEFSNAGDFVVRGAKKKNKCIDSEKWRERLYNEKAILAVEEYALVVFPLSFIAFNVIYWFSVISSLETPAPSE